MNTTNIVTRNVSFPWSPDIFTTNATTSPLLNCSLSADRSFNLNALPLILSSVMILFQLFNLLVFHFWHDKEPFLLFHTSLAVFSLLSGMTTFLTPMIRIIPWNPAVSVPLTNLNVRCIEYVGTLALLNLLCISVDRWLSVDFAIQYRQQISKKRIRIILFSMPLLALLLDVPGFIVYWLPFEAYCDRPLMHSGSLTTARLSWKILTGPVILALAAMFQARIIVVAVKTRLKRLMRKRRPHAHAAGNRVARRSHRRTVRIVWSSLRPSMLVLLVSLISGSPFFFDLSRYTSYPGLLRAFSMLPAVQHMYSPVVYLLFFPQFRKVIVRCCLRVTPRGCRRPLAVNPNANLSHSARVLDICSAVM
ncbi:hypothetical protein BV898_17050 [Hypsibius exemplaris]|uniref:G-protein coupled receptors family 1 profile domain-containing protein n=1 Tax=Hypsibius exemplaris TaxID=2072580 RepID=A0A9X6NLL9_HYPEX|nr:hypothetical protein BV898_17050 [Hypsibius exemplaris]